MIHEIAPKVFDNHYDPSKRPSDGDTVIAFDGNSAAANLIQEAKNGKGRSGIFVWNQSKTLQQKAKSLQGYVNTFDAENSLVSIIKKLI